MPPVNGNPFIDDDDDTDTINNGGTSHITIWYMMVLLSLLLIWFLVYFCLRMINLRQKTRNSQQRRTYMGSRQRPSDTQTEPTIYVSPANLPPPPKYEAMAPPSYEEVVGIHYPNFQPISHPITTALAQSSNTTEPNASNENNGNNANNENNVNNNNNANNGNNVNNINNSSPSTVISVPVAATS